MMPPQSMPIGFTYDGQPMYAAAPRAAGERQPVSGSVVPPGQPQPFGVLSSGAFVWAVEQHLPAPPAPWFRRRGVLVAGAALAAEQPDAPEPEAARPAVDFVMPDVTGKHLTGLLELQLDPWRGGLELLEDPA